MTGPFRVLMVFLDGVGIGGRDPRRNPFFSARLPALTGLTGGWLPSAGSPRSSRAGVTVVPVNATLGVAGLPQSGTGQTALFTGVNAPRLVGKHFGPYPYSSLVPVIARDNIFRRLARLGRKVFFANAFPARYFEYIASHPNRMTVPAMSYLASGFFFNTAAELEEGRALSADITNERWPSMGYPQLERLTPARAGRRLGKIASRHDFTLYEYFLTDHAGHTLSIAHASEALERLDGLLGGVLEEIDPRSTLLLITSDHGNIEDMTVKGHTRNRVPLIAYGMHHREVTAPVRDLTHITPSIVDLFS